MLDELGYKMINTRYYSLKDIETLDLKSIPEHVAFIPDGNRRWAKQQQKQTSDGHREGSDNLIEIVKSGKDLGIKTFTFYLFSTENWSRSADEIDALMFLLHTYLIEQRPIFLEEGARLCTIGDLSVLPEYVQQTINETKEITKDCSSVDLVFALNYGSRNEIKRAFQKIAQKMLDKELTIEDINESLISAHLDTHLWKDPDLLIRTSGEMRLSNFLLWQISYTELYACDTLWPDFTPTHLLQAVHSFQKRQRRLGGS
jgi:undecaprenyl diphosphate synthase